MKPLKSLALFATLTLSWQGAQALELPEIFSSNMVLQQQTQARVWGWAKKGAIIEVSASWDDKQKTIVEDAQNNTITLGSKTYTTTADKKTGRWELQIPTPKASYNTYTMHFIEKDAKGKPTDEMITLSNILIGEVWFCSGQSNMEMPMRGFWNCPVEGANQAIMQSGRYKKSVRVATIPKTPAQEPQDRVPGKWKECDPTTAAEFSALGYYFATSLTDLLDVPVGIINCSWGGSCVEGWLPKDTLMTYPDGIVPFNDTDYMQKMVMYNGMLHPLAGYTIKGFLWNQGESNINRAEEYIPRFISMTNLWRKLWRQPDDKLPMYTVELPPYWYDNNEGTNGAEIRESQHIIAHQLENSGCVCTNDLVYPWESKQIHGTKKLEIGQRLAWMAAARDYNMPGIAAEAPEFERMVKVEADPNQISVIAGTPVAQNKNAKGQIVKLYFSNARDGFSRLSDIEGFEAAGADGQWHKAIVWADSDWQGPAEENGCHLKLVCPEVADVKNVRYNFHNWAPGSLYNYMGLPIVPFCTHF